MTLVFSDALTGNLVTLQAHTPDIGTSWTRVWGSSPTVDLVLTNNVCTPENTINNGCIYTADATYDSTDYYAQFTMVAGPGSDARPIYALVRVQDQENMYAVRIRNTAGSCSLYKKVAGTWTALGSAFDKPADGSVCKLEIIGSALKFYDDGVEIASATDTDITATGEAGLAAGGGAELVDSADDSHNSNQIDNFSVETLLKSLIYAPHLRTQPLIVR